MSDPLVGPKKLELLARKRLEDALYQLNLATVERQEIEEDYRARTIPSPDGDYAFRRAIREESEARLTYLRLSKILENLVLHGKIPIEDDLKVKRASG